MAKSAPSTPVDDSTAVETIAAVFPSSVPVQQSLFASLLEGADTVDGHTLEKSKENLVGIPFVITGAVIRDGVTDKERGKQNYVSVEIVVADNQMLTELVQRGRITHEQASRVYPNEQLVINDGSTGIARQVIAYLHEKKFITVPEGDETGPMGKCRYDTYRSAWKFADGVNHGIDLNTGGFMDVEFKGLRLACLRGLRVSEYDSEFSAGGAATYYIA